MEASSSSQPTFVPGPSLPSCAQEEGQPQGKEEKNKENLDSAWVTTSRADQFFKPPIFDTENANGSSLENVIVVVDVYHI
jgi:hypothetical protein